MTNEYDPVPLGKALGEQTSRLGMGTSRDVGALFARWAEVVGPSVATHVEPIALRNGVLRLRAESPTWATEIGYLREEIRSRINSALGSVAVSRIELSVGPRTSPKPRDDGPGAHPAPAEESPPEPHSKDDPMAAFERARAAWLRRRRWRP